MPLRILLVGLLALIVVSSVRASDRALLIGVERYKDSRVPTAPGCINDAVSLSGFIQRSFGFPASAIKVLINEQATQADIKRQFNDWLVKSTAPGDRVFFFFAGRGTQIPDQNRDERDGFDEAIVPYDIDPGSGEKAILDDVFDGWIAQLSGRRTVLMFDSCFSGTISRGTPSLKDFPQGGGARYLPRADQLKALFGLMRGSNADVRRESYVLQGTSVKDVEHVSSFITLPESVRLTGIIVISAAQANQLAYPLRINGRFRGALSYLFEEVQGQTLPTLQDLQALISTRMRQMHKAGVLEGEQVPQFETISAVPLNSYPLFGRWEMSPVVALINPLSRIRISLRTGQDKVFYQSSENISYEVTTDTPGYLYLIVFSQQERATCIFPNEQDLDNRISPGKYTLPRSPSYAFPIMEPFGRDVAVAVISTERVNLCEKLDYSWSEVFARLDLQNLRQRVTEQATRGVGVKKTTTLPTTWDWQAATVITETRQ